MELKLKKSQIMDLASQYDVSYDDPMENIVPEIKRKQFLNALELLELSDWKLWTGRNTHNIKKNSDISVEEITNFALTAKSEASRIKCLLCLDGVDLAVGSAILHWFHHEENYPVWDFRALETVKFDKTQYKNWFQRWNAYVKFCRQTAQTYDIKMRILDRALWQYSKSAT